MPRQLRWMVPEWPAPDRVRACVTTRGGGISRAPYASFNLADHVGDDPRAVAANRARLRRALALPSDPVWLQQVHGATVVDAATATATPAADASFTTRPGVVCAVLTADCLPVLLSDRAGSRVAIAHVGWRGLEAGVIEATVDALETVGKKLVAWLGPAIGPAAYEVRGEVREALLAADPGAAAGFREIGNSRWLADLYHLARRRLVKSAVFEISGGGACVYREPDRFYSYRRDGRTGRMATLIWIDPRPGSGASP